MTFISLNVFKIGTVPISKCINYIYLIFTFVEKQRFMDQNRHGQ